MQIGKTMKHLSPVDKNIQESKKKFTEANFFLCTVYILLIVHNHFFSW